MRPSSAYVLDTNSIMAIEQARLSEQQRARLWEDLEALVDGGRVLLLDIVFKELDGNAPACAARLRGYRTPPSLVRMKELMTSDMRPTLNTLFNDFKRMSSSGPRDKADPWIVALAKSRSAIVVTEEGTGRQQIPAACRVLNVECVNLLELAIREGFRTGPV